MALRFSKGLRNFLNEGGSLKQAFAGGILEIYSGTQPTTADDAVAGSLLVTIRDNDGTVTSEVQATGSVALTGGASGSVDTLTVNSIAILAASVPFNTSLIQTATDVCKAINDNPKNTLYVADNAGGTSATITLTAKPGLGALPNTWVVASTVTTITKTDTNFSGGVDSANGLLLGDSAAGVITKKSSQTWSGTAGTTGTAGWFRLKGAVADAGAADSTETYFRVDGSIATSGANLNMSSTSVVATALQTLSTFSLTYPAQ